MKTFNNFKRRKLNINSSLIYIFQLLIYFFLFTSLKAQVTEYTLAGSYLYTVPPNVTEIQVLAIGGGGCGQAVKRGNTGNIAGGGGGGGAYAKSLITVSPGDVFSIVVGVGGDGNRNAVGAEDGSPSFVSSGGSLIIRAAAGKGKTRKNGSGSGAGSAGGLASNSIGDVVYSGGAGSAALNHVNTGAGGGAAGYIGNGVDGIGLVAGLGTTPGGDGAAGNYVPGGGSTPGNYGKQYGGGGSGGGRRQGNGLRTDGGDGANGYVKIIEILPKIITNRRITYRVNKL